MVRLANAPCSWGVIERTLEDERSYGYKRVLDEMQETGFVGTELGDWEFMPTDPVVLKKEVEKRNLSLIASWVTALLIDSKGHADSVAQAVRTARLLSKVAPETPVIVIGGDFLADKLRNSVVGRVKPEHSMNADQWKIFVEGLHHLARSVHDQTGLRTVFHPHCGTWVEAPLEIVELLNRTDPELVGLCLDTGHYRFGGGDPLAGLREHWDRIWHVHFKDCDPEIADQARSEGWEYRFAVGKGVFCELGKGDVDFPAIVALLNEMHFDGWVVVEQDVLPSLGSPKESAQRNRDYLRSIGL